MTTSVVGVSTGGGSSVIGGAGTSVNVGIAPPSVLLLVRIEVMSAVVDVVRGMAGSVSDRVKVARVVLGEPVRDASSSLPSVGSGPGPGTIVTDTVVVCSTVWFTVCSMVCSTVCVTTEVLGADWVVTVVGSPLVTVTWLVTMLVGFIVTVTCEGAEEELELGGLEELGELGEEGAGALPEPPLRIFSADASSTQLTWTPVVVFIGRA